MTLIGVALARQLGFVDGGGQPIGLARARTVQVQTLDRRAQPCIPTDDGAVCYHEMYCQYAMDWTTQDDSRAAISRS